MNYQLRTRPEAEQDIESNLIIVVAVMLDSRDPRRWKQRA